MFPCPGKAPDWQPAVEPEAAAESAGVGGGASDANSNEELGAAVPSPPPASPASGGSLSETASVSSEEALAPGDGPEAPSQEQGTAVAAVEPGAGLTESRSPQPVGAASEAQAGSEGIATSLASLILSEAIARATDTVPPAPEKAPAPAGDPRQPDSSAPGEPPSPAPATPCDAPGPVAEAAACPSAGGGQEPCRLGSAVGEQSDPEESVEVMDVEPKVARTQVRSGGAGWETPWGGGVCVCTPGWRGSARLVRSPSPFWGPSAGDAGTRGWGLRGANPARCDAPLLAGGAGAGPRRGVEPPRRGRQFPL